ncbi:MAG: hypothetical protein MR272_06130 [Pseudoflavonifractor sp.]|nr:hypothetical protein [Pseudoflavonifractor sp.]MDY3019334.1 hypothetical protein [Oscillospiraceae bacterium]
MKKTHRTLFQRILPIIFIATILIFPFFPRPLSAVIRAQPSMLYTYRTEYGAQPVNGDHADEIVSAMNSIIVIFSGWSKGIPDDGPVLILRTQDNNIIEILSTVNGESSIYRKVLWGQSRYKILSGVKETVFPPH